MSHHDPRFQLRHLSFAAALLALGVLGSAADWLAAAEDSAAVEARLFESVKFLASDELEGRGIGTRGLGVAADYLAAQFAALGLKCDLVDGGPFQKFTMTTTAKLGAENSLALVGRPGADGQEQRVELKLGEDFTPFATSGSGPFDLPLAFVGYGITGREEGYDDYAGIDVQGRAVVVLRHEPQQADEKSPFAGARPSQYAPFSRKISNAYEHGAAAVIFVTDQFDIDRSVAHVRGAYRGAIESLSNASVKFKEQSSPSEDQWREFVESTAKLNDRVQKLQRELTDAADPLMPFDSGGGGEGEGRKMPVLYCKRAALARMFQSVGADLAALEKAIDAGPAPRSRELAGWRAVGRASVEREEVEVKNILAELPGAGPLAGETIVIGAHYDHLGYGGANSAAPGVNDIHNGADDNGSGSSALIEVARVLASRGQTLPRRVVFIAFTGEERGLVGSARYIKNPVVPLESTVAMLNLDMVGRLVDEKLIVAGTGSASEFDATVERLGTAAGFVLTKQPGGFGPSDHSSFYGAQIPVLHFFTGTHADYHRPSDDYDKINVPGMRRIAQLVVQIAEEIAQAPARPTYQNTGAPPQRGSGGDRPYFGSIPDFSQDQPGYALQGVTADGPAARAGLKAGDIIVKLGDSLIGNLEDFDSALRKYKAGEAVKVVARRGDAEVEVRVTLDPPR